MRLPSLAGVATLVVLLVAAMAAIHAGWPESFGPPGGRMEGIAGADPFFLIERTYWLGI